MSHTVWHVGDQHGSGRHWYFENEADAQAWHDLLLTPPEDPDAQGRWMPFHTYVVPQYVYSTLQECHQEEEQRTLDYLAKLPDELKRNKL